MSGHTPWEKIRRKDSAQKLAWDWLVSRGFVFNPDDYHSLIALLKEYRKATTSTDLPGSVPPPAQP